MKKILVTLMLSLFCLMVQGQAHMKFMGIPLTGNVDLFTQKLKAKGLTCDVAKTKASPSGTKFYKGVFMGEDAEFMIMFNSKDKTVFGVEVYIEYSTKESVKEQIVNIFHQLKEKYPDAAIGLSKNDDGDVDGIKFSIPDKEKKNLMGLILQKTITPDGIHERNYRISLLYCDVANFTKSEKRNYDDL